MHYAAVVPLNSKATKISEAHLLCTECALRSCSQTLRRHQTPTLRLPQDGYKCAVLDYLPAQYLVLLQAGLQASPKLSAQRSSCHPQRPLLQQAEADLFLISKDSRSYLPAQALAPLQADIEVSSEFAGTSVRLLSQSLQVLLSDF